MLKVKTLYSDFILSRGDKYLDADNRFYFIVPARASNREVIDKMRKIITLDEVFKVKLNSDYNFTDPSTKKYRYQCIFDITY